MQSRQASKTVARQLFTAAGIRRIAHGQKSSLLIVGPGATGSEKGPSAPSTGRVTPEAYDVANETGVRILREATPSTTTATPTPATAASLPPLKAVRRAGVALQTFGSDAAAQAANVRLKDVITSADGSPMAAGYMSLDQGSFAWTLNYDEVDIVIEGELEIRRGDEVARAGPGDCIFVPRGSSITFGTPGYVRFFYVTFPADWQ
jgi:ethanolamine utilization protein EutQ